MPADDGSSLPVGRVARIVPAVTGVRKTFDYLVPPELDDRITVGTEVRVVLHNRRVGGWVVEDAVAPMAGVRLRPVAAVRGLGPPSSVVELAAWAAWRWAGPVPTFLRTASSDTAVRALPHGHAATGDTGLGGGPVRSGDRLGDPLVGRIVDPPVDPIVGPTATEHDELAPLIEAALGGGVTLLRVPPAADSYGVVDAVVARLATGVGRGVLVLAPSHRVVAALAHHLRRSGHVVAELPGQWARARAGGCVVVGSRAAAFAPLPHIHAAVVLDAHDEAYVEERAPTWSAWTVAAERARRDAAPCIFISPCPTLELLAAGHVMTMSRRAERRGWPVIDVLDRSQDDPRTGLFSPRLVELLRWAHEKPGRRVACVLNRTGRVRLLACAACHQLARCEHCGGALEASDAPALVARTPVETRAAMGPVLQCRRCRRQRPVVCAQCGATRFKALRSGVTRVSEEIAALTNAAVTEMWGPVPSRPRRDEDSSGSGGFDAGVVVGTEAVLHRVDMLDAVCFLDFDAELLAPRLHGAEEALALLARAARLVSHSTVEVAAGGGRSPGRVLVQTRQPRHEVIRAAVTADPGILATSELQVRRLLRLPPVTAMAVVSGDVADDYGRALADAAPPEVEVSGPVDGFWSVRAPDHEALCDLLASVPRPTGRMRVEVDPVRR